MFRPLLSTAAFVTGLALGTQAFAQDTPSADTVMATVGGTDITLGHMLAVRDIRIDCDQDAVWVKAVPAGPTCHTGARSCFFRRVGADGLMAVDAAD